MLGKIIWISVRGMSAGELPGQDRFHLHQHPSQGALGCIQSLNGRGSPRNAWAYGSSRGLNTLADQGDFLKVTKRINNGTNGSADRQALYDKALKVVA